MIKLGIRTALIFALLGVVAGSVGIGAASASNTTGVTCKPTTAGGGFSDSHCVNKVTDGAAFFHQSLPENTSLPITITGAVPTTVKDTFSSVSVAVECETAAGTGILNTQGGAEMYSWGTAEITFSSCTVASPVGFGCVVSGGTMKTKPLLFTAKGAGMGVKFSPETGTTLAEVKIEGCALPISVLNNTWSLSGSVVLTPHGATLNSTHAETTAQGTLTFVGGNVAGLATSLTLKGKVTGWGIAWTT